MDSLLEFYKETILNYLQMAGESLPQFKLDKLAEKEALEIRVKMNINAIKSSYIVRKSRILSIDIVLKEIRL